MIEIYTWGAIATFLALLAILRINRKAMAKHSATNNAIAVLILTVTWPILPLAGVCYLLVGKKLPGKAANDEK